MASPTTQIAFSILGTICLMRRLEGVLWRLFGTVSAI